MNAGIVATLISLRRPFRKNAYSFGYLLFAGAVNIALAPAVSQGCAFIRLLIYGCASALRGFTDW
jgi:hypothetical protein